MQHDHYGVALLKRRVPVARANNADNANIMGSISWECTTKKKMDTMNALAIKASTKCINAKKTFTASEFKDKGLTFSQMSFKITHSAFSVPFYFLAPQ